MQNMFAIKLQNNIIINYRILSSIYKMSKQLNDLNKLLLFQYYYKIVDEGFEP